MERPDMSVQSATTGSFTHTPGPWHVTDAGEVFAADDFEVCDPTQGPHLHKDHDGNNGHWGTTPGAHIEREIEEEFANAHLIAAAPTMLSALQHIADATEISAADIEIVLEAIAAAKGGA